MAPHGHPPPHSRSKLGQLVTCAYLPAPQSPHLYVGTAGGTSQSAAVMKEGVRWARHTAGLSWPVLPSCSVAAKRSCPERGCQSTVASNSHTFACEVLVGCKSKHNAFSRGLPVVGHFLGTGEPWVQSPATPETTKTNQSAKCRFLY